MRRRRKKADPVPKLILEEVIGLTTKDGGGLASDVSRGRCAYLAGCVVVLYDVGTGARTHLMVSSRAPKPLSCVTMARQGRGFVAAGESGNAAAVLIWDYSAGNLLSELKGHRCGVQSIDFSSDGKSLVSLGFLNDGYLCLWDWRSGRLLAKVKASTTFCPILSVSFLSEGSSFMTVGRKHLKLWTIGSVKSMSTNVGKELPSIDGKPVNLGCCKGSCFVSVASSAWATSKSARSDQILDSFPLYALTETGTLCVLDQAISIGKFVDLKVRKGFALSASDNLIACACNSGLVQLLHVQNLTLFGSLKYGNSNGYIDVINMACRAQPLETCPEHADTVPDAIACQFLSATKLAVIYADHSFYIWDIDHTQKVSKCCILVAHSACIWDIQNLPHKKLHGTDLMYEANGRCDEVSFATCSVDGTIRLWDLALLSYPTAKHEQSQLIVNQQNCSRADNEPVSSVQLVSCGILEHENVDKELHAQGFRSMAVSSDGEYLAAGDCCGNLHVFNLHTSSYTCIEEAHDAEILSINFSNKQAVNKGELENQHFLVTGGRDRMVHVHNAQRSFDLIESLDDHSAPVTSVILACDGCKLLSCSTDRSILFRDVLITDVGCKVVRRHHQLASHGTIMAIDPTRKLVVTVGQDRKVNKYNLTTGRLVASFKEEGDTGQPIKVTVDPSGSYLVCSYSNKSLRIYDFVTGELVAQAMGHAEVITGSIILPNCKHLVSVGGDSCILIWKLPALLSSNMLKKTKENAGYLPTTIATQSLDSLQDKQHKAGSAHPNLGFDHVLKAAMFYKEDSGVTIDRGFGGESTFKFSISRLPKWAQTKLTSKPIPSQESGTKISSGVFSPSKCFKLEVMEEGISTSLGGFFSVGPGTNPSGVEGLIVEGCSSNNVTETMSLDVIAKESVSTLLVLGNANKVAGGRVKCTLSEQEINLAEERQDDGVDNVAACCEVAIEKAQAKISNTEKRRVSSQTTLVGGCGSDFPCNENPSQHYGNLSAILMLEGKTSIRKRFSAHFHVRRDCLSSCKRLFVTAKGNLGQVASADLESSLGPPTKTIKDVSQPDNINQGKMNDKVLPSARSCFSRETDIADCIKKCHLNNSNLTANSVQTPGLSKGNGMQRGMSACRTALHNLDEAAETALRLCTELGVKQIREKKSDKLGTELFSLVADTLPSILEKVQALTDLVRSDNADSSSNYEPEALDLEPVIERFADSFTSCT